MKIKSQYTKFPSGIKFDIECHSVLVPFSVTNFVVFLEEENNKSLQRSLDFSLGLHYYEIYVKLDASKELLEELDTDIIDL